MAWHSIYPQNQNTKLSNMFFFILIDFLLLMNDCFVLFYCCLFFPVLLLHACIKMAMDNEKEKKENVDSQNPIDFLELNSSLPYTLFKG